MTLPRLVYWVPLLGTLAMATFMASLQSHHSTILGTNNQVGILLYNEQEKEIVSDLVHRMCRRAIEMDGTVTGEHGVGLKKREYLREELGEDTLSTMRRVSLQLAHCFLSRPTDTNSIGEASTRSSGNPQP